MAQEPATPCPAADNTLEQLVRTHATDMVPNARYLIRTGAPISQKAIQGLLESIAAWQEGDGEELLERQMELLALFVYHGAKAEPDAACMPADKERAKAVQAVLRGEWGWFINPDAVCVPPDTDNAALLELFRQEGYPPAVLRAVREFGLENTRPLGEEKEKQPIKLRILPQTDFIVLHFVFRTLTWDTYVATQDGLPLLHYSGFHTFQPAVRAYRDGDDFVLERADGADRFPILGKNQQPGVRRYWQYRPDLSTAGPEYARALPAECGAHRYEPLLEAGIQAMDKLGEALSGIHDKAGADAAAPAVAALREELRTCQQEMSVFTQQDFPKEVWEYFALIRGLYEKENNAAVGKALGAFRKLTNADFYGSDALRNVLLAPAKANTPPCQ